jgi:hypothetical protein
MKAYLWHQAGELPDRDDEPLPAPRLPNYEVVYTDPEVVRIVDRGPWDQFPTVTNRVERVVEKLVEDGILKEGMRLFYYDSEGEFSEILIWDLMFAGFKACVE